MSIITDFKSIGELARLRALDGRPQDEVTAGIAKVEPVKPVEPPEGWHVFWQANLCDTAPSELAFGFVAEDDSA